MFRCHQRNNCCKHSKISEISFNCNNHDVISSLPNLLPIDQLNRSIYNPMDVNVLEKAKSFKKALRGYKESKKYFVSYTDSKGNLLIEKKPLVELPCSYPLCNITTCFPARWCLEHMEEKFHVEIVQSLIIGAGLGLRFTSDLPSDSIVAEYNGVIVDKKTFEKTFCLNDSTSVSSFTSEHSLRNHSNGTGYSYSEEEDDKLFQYYVDTTFLRDVGSFVNEPAFGERPNCVFYFNGHTNILEIKTIRDCKKNEEASVNYTASGRKKSYFHNKSLCITHGYKLDDYPINSYIEPTSLGVQQKYKNIHDRQTHISDEEDADNFDMKRHAR